MEGGLFKKRDCPQLRFPGKREERLTNAASVTRGKGKGSTDSFLPSKKGRGGSHEGYGYLIAVRERGRGEAIHEMSKRGGEGRSHFSSRGRKPARKG